MALDVTARARSLGCQICVNPNYRPTAWQGGPKKAANTLREATDLADVAIMNAEEVMLITGQPTVERAADAWRRQFSAFGAITQGADPVLLVGPDGVDEVPAQQTTVRYDIGAGDTFHAGFLVRWCEGAAPRECAEFAIQAATIKIQRPPLIADLPTRHDVEAAIIRALGENS
jgi:sugar/nucleoside kinase (ribokinase family)